MAAVAPDIIADPGGSCGAIRGGIRWRRRGRPLGGTLTLNLDIDGFFLGPEFAAILAALFTAIFGGFANALIGNAFGSGV